MKPIRQRAFEIVQPCKQGDVVSKVFDRALTFLIFLNTISCFIETFNPDVYLSSILKTFDIVSVSFFTVEYIVRICTADYLFPEEGAIKSRIRYIVSFMGIIDLVSILPFFLPMFFGFDLRSLRMLRIVRFARVFKLGGYIDGLDAVIDTVRQKRHELISSISVILIFMLVASMLVYEFEYEAQPDVFVNGFSGLWWAFETLTTVGYGDIYPITMPGKILSVCIALAGIVLIAVPSGIIASGLTEGTIRGGKLGGVDTEEVDELIGAVEELIQLDEEVLHASENADGEHTLYCAYCGCVANASNGRRYCTHCGKMLDA